MSFTLTLIGALIAVVIPESWYLAVVSYKYVGIKSIVAGLTGAIVLLSVSNILSHYFSGLGLYKVNAYASFLGLIVTVGLGSWLIPSEGILGAIITLNMSYFVMTSFQFIHFYKRCKFKTSDFFITRNDIKLVRGR